MIKKTQLNTLMAYGVGLISFSAKQLVDKNTHLKRYNKKNK